MITENKTKEARLDFFDSLYRKAYNAYSDKLESFERAMRQYRGSTEIDGSDEAAVTTRNITYEIVESQVSSDIPAPKADALYYSERRERNALAIERLCRSVRDKLPFEEMNDIDERYTYIYGGSVWYADWDNSREAMGEVGSVKIECISPLDFVPEPGIYNIDDMEYCFIRTRVTRGELFREYELSGDELMRLGDDELGAPSVCDAATVIICFYRDADGEISRYVYSGDVVLSDVEKYYRRKRTFCPVCKLEGDECTCRNKKHKQVDVITESIPRLKLPSSVVTSEDISDPYRKAEVPYYVPTSFPIVIRKNTSAEGSLFGQSDCDYIRPEQQAINKIESRILKKLVLAGVTPIIPEDASITLDNRVFGRVIRLKPGESAAQYGKVDTTPDISQDIAEAERLYDHAKRIIGISDAYQGIDTGSVNESGYAKQLRISQATGRLESKKKMKHTAYARLDRIIFSLYLAFADEPRSLAYKDAYGRVHNAEFNRYDFIEYDIRTGEYYYDDSYLFTVDLNGGNEYQRESLWQRNLENLKAGTLGDPEDPVTLFRYWQCQERAHYPYARENVEYFKDAERRSSLG